jgi:hypothetical protein
MLAPKRCGLYFFKYKKNDLKASFKNFILVMVLLIKPAESLPTNLTGASSE